MADPIPGLELVSAEPRVDFEPAGFRLQVQRWGHRFRWERASRCPCSLRYADSGDDTYTARLKAGQPGCEKCRKGAGYLYNAAQDIKALVNDASADKRFLQAFGEIAFGAVKVSMLPEHLPAWRDRLTDLDGARVFQEEPRVRVEAIEQPTYPILVRSMPTGSDSDPTIVEYRPIGVLTLHRSDSTGVYVGECVIGVDFQVTAEGAIEFLDDSLGLGPPAVGEGYSLAYTCYPAYIVRSHPHVYRHTYVQSAASINVIDGYQDAWDAGDGTFPTGTIRAGDYYEVTGAGTVDSLAFVVGDLLVARIDSPSDSSADDWIKVSDSDEPQAATLVPLTVLALCWLEDLGDPFDRTGTP